MSGGSETETRRAPPGVALRPVLATVAGSLLLLGGTVWGLHRLYVSIVQHPYTVEVSPLPAPEIRPDLRAVPGGERSAKEELGSFAWVDRERGIASIPIERAMEIMAGRGEAAWGTRRRRSTLDGARRRAVRTLALTLALLLGAGALPASAALTQAALDGPGVQPPPGARVPSTSASPTRPVGRCAWAHSRAACR